LVIDKNGEELHEVMIKSITNDAQGGLVEVLGGLNKYEDGDEVII